MTEIRSRLNLRSTHEGANNRLDIHSIYSYDRDMDMATPFTGELAVCSSSMQGFAVFLQLHVNLVVY
jgi:hypothetical protein